MCVKKCKTHKKRQNLLFPDKEGGSLHQQNKSSKAVGKFEPEAVLATLCPWVTLDKVNLLSAKYGWCLLSCTVVHLDVVVFEVLLVGDHALPSAEDLPPLGRSPRNFNNNLHKLCSPALNVETMRQVAP